MRILNLNGEFGRIWGFVALREFCRVRRKFDALWEVLTRVCMCWCGVELTHGP